MKNLMKKKILSEILFFLLFFIFILNNKVYALENVYSNAKTDNSGKNIYVTFTKNIDSSSINNSDFTIKIGTNTASISKINIVEENQKQICINISDSVNSSSILRVNYNESGKLKTSDGINVSGFDQSVVNNYGKSASYYSASVNSDGKTIVIKFNKALDSNSVNNLNTIIKNKSNGYNSLKVIVDNTEQNIEKIELTNNSYITITLSDYLNTSQNALYLTYNGSTLLTYGGAPIEPFTNKSVTFTFATPKIVSASVNTDGDKVILIFNVPISQDSLNNVINNEQLTIKPSSTKDVLFTGEVSNIPTKVYLNLSDELKKSETVKVYYKTGNYELLSTTGKAVPAFTKTADKASSNSTPKVDSISLNKDGDKITITFDQEISSIESTDSNYGFTIQGKDNNDTNEYDIKSYEISKKKLYLYLDSSIDGSESVKIKYEDDDSDILTISEAELKSFSYKTIENNVKTDEFILKDSYTDANGNYIYLVFNDNIDDVGDNDNFTVTINGNKATISSININSSNSKKLDIKLSTSFTGSDKIKVSYDPDDGDEDDPLKSEDDVEAEIFNNETITNSLNESSTKVKSASLSSDGKVVTVTMNSSIKSSSVNKSYFTINDKSIISSVSVSSKDITINLSEAVSGNVKVAYNSYYIEDTSGNKIPPFIIYTSGSSTTSGSWIKQPNGWQWKYSDGNIAKKTWIDTGNGTWYAFDDNGTMRTSWFLENGIWYYLDPTNGDMKTGWNFINNKWYYFYEISNGSRGSMQTGWIFNNNKWYYLDPTNGDMKTGWIEYKGNRYYLDLSSGAMYSNTTITIDNKSYRFDSNGVSL